MTFPNQIENRNFLSPVGFRFTLSKYKKVSFFCNTAKIPSITLGTELQATYLKNIDVPGDIIAYNDLTLTFLVDENMENYLEIHNWITGLGFPETTKQYKDLITSDESQDINEGFSDGTLYILNSNYNTVRSVIFQDLYPVSLSSLDFNASETDIEYFTAQATFKYTVYTIQ